MGNRTFSATILKLDSPDTVSGRTFPKDLMEAAIEKYTADSISHGRGVCWLQDNASGFTDLSTIWGKCTRLYITEDTLYGDFEVLNTDMGDTVAILMDGGVSMDIQLGGMGTLSKDKVVGDDFEIINFGIGNIYNPKDKKNG